MRGALRNARPLFARRRSEKATLEPPPQTAEQRPRELAADLLKRLEFNVVRPLDGFLFGDYSGLFYGPSLDLAEVREYQPGDEVRRIDWYVTARTGTVHVRQYREEREIRAWLIVDLSASMDFGTRRVLKRELALEFAGVVASIISRTGNKVGAVGFSHGATKITPLGSGRRQAFTIVQNLLTQGTGHRTAPAPTGSGDELTSVLEDANRTMRRRALVFVISDFISSLDTGQFEREPVWSRELRRLAFRHDVITVRITDPAERELPKVGDLRLRDPETGHEAWIDTSDPRVRRAHAQLVEKRDRAITRVLRASRVDQLELSTERDLIEPLLKFTLHRKGRRS
ncbi:MAG: DUF58 domain-containing protein [Trueperaceae bacterium]|nr:MAG: DUF58 domain-containing protein [Trueperaceae bacterium]